MGKRSADEMLAWKREMVVEGIEFLTQMDRKKCRQDSKQKNGTTQKNPSPLDRRPLRIRAKSLRTLKRVFFDIGDAEKDEYDRSDKRGMRSGMKEHFPPEYGSSDQQ